MTEFAQSFVIMWENLFGLLNSISFDFYGYEVTYLSVILAFFALSMIISVFWKGAKA